MPFQRPTLSQLIERILTDIEARLPGADARLRRALLGVLGKVAAGAAHGLHGHLEFLGRQVIVDTAEAEYLERWASIWGVARKPAAPAVGGVTFTGVDASVIPAGTELQRADGTAFTLDADATIVAGSAAGQVTASVAGGAGNAGAGSALALVNPVAGVNNAAPVAAGGLTGGVDSESDEALLGRLLARIQQPPHGGAAFDYVAWALEVAGVTRAWCYPLSRGDGTVDVLFVLDDQAGSIIPDAGLVAEVQAYIDARRPVTADFLAVAPTAVPLDFTIQLTPNTAAVQAAVQAELEDLLRRDAAPGATIYLSRIREAISLAAGELNHVLTAPAADAGHLDDEIAVMGVITWS
ncbi:MAG: baseplate J protein [Spirochaetes bacterium GWB1_59_5]|nr:MAG: baseplate J protein [Spirochaetes bacterium GWB1_59_5]